MNQTHRCYPGECPRLRSGRSSQGLALIGGLISDRSLAGAHVRGAPGHDWRFWGATCLERGHAQAPAGQENTAACEHTCPRKLTKWRTESWSFSQAAWPMGRTKWKGRGAHPGMYYWLPPSCPVVPWAHRSGPRQPLTGIPHGGRRVLADKHGPGQLEAPGPQGPASVCPLCAMGRLREQQGVCAEGRALFSLP